MYKLTVFLSRRKTEIITEIDEYEHTRTHVSLTAIVDIKRMSLIESQMVSRS